LCFLINLVFKQEWKEEISIISEEKSEPQKKLTAKNAKKALRNRKDKLRDLCGEGKFNRQER